MILYRITTLFLGKELEERATIGYLVALDDSAVYQYISDNIAWGEPWEEQYEHGARQRIMEKHNDYEEEFMGEAYDQKFGWEVVKVDIPQEEILVLKQLGILLS
jgi:hypothetical protein